MVTFKAFIQRSMRKKNKDGFDSHMLCYDQNNESAFSMSAKSQNEKNPSRQSGPNYQTLSMDEKKQ